MFEELLTRGVAEVINADSLNKKLKSNQKLRVKLGIDPTAPDLHLGHTIVMRKLRQFQKAGHTPVLIIGDYTARIGDPSGRDKTRPALTLAHIKKHLENFEDQIFKILDRESTEIRYQSEWFKNFGLADVIELASKISLWHVLSHETFALRKQKGQSLMIHEILYPLLQGYDSVAVKADVELGGTDQKFNLLTGRVVQQAFGQKPQDVITMPYLLGIDGKQKMSKSIGNTINLTDEPNEVFGKVMSIPDNLILPYFELDTDLEYKALGKVKEEALSGNPRDAKARLAFLIVESLYDEQAAQGASDSFNKQFRESEVPENVKETTIQAEAIAIVDALVKTGLAKSKQEAARVIGQKGVRVDGKKVSNSSELISTNNTIIQVGKRRFARLLTGV